LHCFYLKRFFHSQYIKIKGVPVFMLHTGKEGLSEACRYVVDKMKGFLMEDGVAYPGLHIINNMVSMSHHSLYTQQYGAQPIASWYVNSLLYYPSPTMPQQDMEMPLYCMKNRTSASRLPEYPSVLVEYDNTPRRSREHAQIWSRVHRSSGPINSFERDLIQAMMYERCCQSPMVRESGGQFVTVNAWNQWAEGMVLEASTRHSTNMLLAVRRAKDTVESIHCNWNKFQKLPVIAHPSFYRVDNQV
jgi:hypothetical protein